MAKTEAETVGKISSKTLLPLGLVISACGVCFVIGVAYNNLWWKVDNNERGMAQTMGKADKAVRDIAKNCGDVALAEEHLLALKVELAAKTKDGWQKVNDMAFMQEFCRINGLKMVPHIRIVEIGRLNNMVIEACEIKSQ